MAQTSYLDFDIEFERSGDGYRLEIDSPAGQLTQPFSLPFSALEIENTLLRLGRPQIGVRGMHTPETDAARVFGTRQFDAVFRDEVRGCWRSSIEEASRQGVGVRIRLRLNDTPELASLPWEYLYNSALDRFLALSSQTPLVRYLELPERIRPLTMTTPLRILTVIAAPRGVPPLDTEREWNKLNQALADLIQRKLVIVDRLNPATLPALQQQLHRQPYHALHFIGHGNFDARSQIGSLLFEDSEGEAARVSSSDLGVVLHDHGSLRLVVLNACEGGRPSNDDPFGGTAPRLVQQGIPAVIAMQFPVTDEAAITFSNGFYGALADNYPVDAALAEACKALLTDGSGVEWGTPVLYMRAPDGYIFDLTIPPTLQTTPAPAPQPAPSTNVPPTQPKPTLQPAYYVGAGLAILLILLIVLLSLGQHSTSTVAVVPTAAISPATSISTVAAPTPIARAASIPTAAPVITIAPAIALITPKSVATVAPIATGEYLILIAQPEPLGTARRDVARAIVDDLQRRLEREIPFSKLHIQAYPHVITSADEATSAAQSNAATIIVWGNYDDNRVELNVQIGVIDHTTDLPVDDGTLRRTAEVLVRLRDERTQTIVLPVLTAINMLQTSTGSIYDLLQTVSIQSSATNNIAEVVGQGSSARINAYIQNYAGNTPVAINELSLAIENEDGNPLLRLYRAVAYVRLGKVDQAHDDLAIVSNLVDHPWASSLSLQAMTELLNGQLDQARTTLNQIVTIRPNDWFALTFRGYVAYKQGDFDTAHRDIDQAIALKPPVNWAYSVGTLIALREGNLTEAVRLSAEARERIRMPIYGDRILQSLLGNQINSVAPITAAYSNLLFEQYSAAIADTQRAIAVGPTNADPYLMQGLAYCALKRYPEAETSYSAGINREPDFILLWLLRAEVRAKQANPAAASDLATVQASSQASMYRSIIIGFQQGKLGCATFLSPTSNP
jgi:Flp pilus assembly protein TadD